jgi:predicted RNase H-like HicB family nuclease
MKYKVNIQESEEGFTVWAPECPGCWAQGVTEEDALEKIKAELKRYHASSEEGQNRNIDTRFVDVD